MKSRASQGEFCERFVEGTKPVVPVPIESSESVPPRLDHGRL